MKIALFPGSFDPFTIGHANIVERALQMFDHVVIGIGVNASKKNIRETDLRLQRLRDIYKDEPRVSVEAYTDLTIDLAHRVNAKFIIRGLRSVKDFEYERDIANMNKKLGDGLETVLLFTEPEYQSISSSVVRELMQYGKDVTEFLP